MSFPAAAFEKGRFPVYAKHSPLVPTLCLTPEEGGALHRFFDTCPLSPSGRFLAFFRMPFENRYPAPGEAGGICVLDLDSGEERRVASSRGWEPQMGANLQWGADDATLFFNDVDPRDWSCFCVKLDWPSGKAERQDGWIYQVSPDGSKALASNPTTMRRTQNGYGVVIPDARVPRFAGPQRSDGIYLSDLASGTRKLLISTEEVFARAMPEAERKAALDQEVYGFHSKWNFDGSRIMFSLRRFAKGACDFGALNCGVRIRYDVFTMKPDGSELFDAIPAELWERGGHHTTWMADGLRLSFNLGDLQGGLDLMQVRFDGSGLAKLCQTKGSGHPSENPKRPGLLVTDQYSWEKGACGDGSIYIRLIDLASDSERRLLRIDTCTPYEKGEACLRVDPHVVWDRTGRFAVFNAFDGGTRRIYLADLRAFVS